MPRGRPQKERNTRLGKYLTECRERAGLTLSKAAERAHVDKAYLSRLETSGKTPPSHVVRSLAIAYDKNITKFLRTFDYQELPLIDTEGMKDPRKIPDEVLEGADAAERHELKRYLMFLRTRNYIHRDIVAGSQ